ncbi:hypothetical protein H5410_022066 [Solanum commersonii]|uniref:Uncharacterized protein n=1 Tax=Solanum commersonii TaxID=4109 RepID=A0A9J5ZD43_SOLCO|nr:hypothetical protein H5410_022066 [Solanum commersonii]
MGSKTIGALGKTDPLVVLALGNTLTSLEMISSLMSLPQLQTGTYSSKESYSVKAAIRKALLIQENLCRKKFQDLSLFSFVLLLDLFDVINTTITSSKRKFINLSPSVLDGERRPGSTSPQGEASGKALPFLKCSSN